LEGDFSLQGYKKIYPHLIYTIYLFVPVTAVTTTLNAVD